MREVDSPIARTVALIVAAAEGKSLKKLVFSKPNDESVQRTVVTLRQIGGRLMAQKNPRTLKRFIRCTNHEAGCETSYPLPQRGELEATGEVCETCGAPEVIVHTNRGPWRICVNMNCPKREEEAAKKTTRKTTSRKRTTAKKSTTKRTTRKKS